MSPAARIRLVLCVGLVLGLSAGTASAQDGFDVQQFNPEPSQTTNLFGVSQARILQDGQWELGLTMNYGAHPLVITNDDGDRLESIVSGQFVGNVLGAIGIADRLELGIDIPLILLQTGDELELAPELDASDAGFGLGDIRFVPRLLMLDTDLDGAGSVALAFIIDTQLPTGSSDVYQGGEFRVEPYFAFDYATTTEIRISVNAGFLVRPETEIENLNVGNALTWGLGLDAPVGMTRALHIVGELAGEASVAGSSVNAEETPLEALLGVKYFLDNGVMVQGGAGAGLLDGYGTPDWRVFFGVHYSTTPEDDRDGDGVPNDVDECPEIPEDIDRWEDEDGCPDTDNDGDGFLDVDEECDNEPEDPDDFENDGCPDPDNDQDGIEDAVDQCELEPEDIDEFEDSDGCPDPDNDGDGYLDVDEECDNEPEDDDDFENDGCPDLDNDGDGMLDRPDRCPNEAEDFDGFEDEDGCPEEGSGLITLTCEAVEISEQVQFESDSDEILEESYELLDQVATVLRTATYIQLVRVEGHTDDRGDDDYNLDLSNRRANAVMTYLIDNGGIDGTRLTAEGFGESQPIADNESSDGRRQNRRVAFVIVEQDSACE